MSEPYITRCPHCGQSLEIPYRSIMKEMAKRSGAKRRNDSKYMQGVIHRKWFKRGIHPKQQEILDLSNHQNLGELTLKEIADKVGILGPHRENYVWRHINRLKQKGLLSAKG